MRPGRGGSKLVGLTEAELDLRTLRWVAILTEKETEEVACAVGFDTHDERPSGSGSDGHRLRSLGGVKDELRLGLKRRTRLGESETPCGAFDQLGAEMSLDHCDAAGHRRLRHTQFRAVAEKLCVHATVAKSR